jgi:HSP20 family protein
MSVSGKPRAPLDELALLRREINQLFERLGAWSDAEQPSAGEWFPGVDVFESRGRLIVQIEVPGLPPDALRVSVRAGQLVIVGQRRAQAPPGRFLCVERPLGRFRRAIPIEAAVDLRAAEARLAHGVLTVVLPRLKERRSQEIVIPVVREPEP